MEDLEEKPEPKWKKPLLAIISIILAGLVISLIVVSYPIGNILQGQLASEPLQGDRILLDNLEIIFTDGTIDQIKMAYLSEQKVEFSLCLLGRKIGNDYYINEIFKPRQFSQAFNQVTFEPCNKETLILFHTHPYKSCIASATDLQTLRETQEKNPEVIMVVMCEPERFSVYS